MTILTAVQSLCLGMVVPPVDTTPFKAGNIVASKAGNKYRLRKCRKTPNVFELQSHGSNLILHGKYNQRQLELAGVKKA